MTQGRRIGMRGSLKNNPSSLPPTFEPFFVLCVIQSGVCAAKNPGLCVIQSAAKNPGSVFVSCEKNNFRRNEPTDGSNDASTPPPAVVQ